jgi:hypothetical protein
MAAFGGEVTDQLLRRGAGLPLYWRFVAYVVGSASCET